MTLRSWLRAAAFTAGIAIALPATAADNPPAKPVFSFASLKSMTVADAKAKAEAYLTKAGAFDAKAFASIWADESRSVLDRTADSLALSNTEAAAALAMARKADGTAPTATPGFIKDAAADPFFKANVATAYAKALTQRNVFEESLDALKSVSAEQTVDPAAFYFAKAVAEHKMILREPAIGSIARLLDDVADAPDRYRMVATLMFFDMQQWSKDDKDLANIGRLMDNSGRRLDLARGGPKTQDIQKQIVFRLDEVIKDLENQCKGGNCNGGNCPNGGKPGNGNNIRPNSPAPDSTIMGGGGPGGVDSKKLRQYAEVWGKLPAAERAKAVNEMSRDLPAKHRQMVEDYFKALNRMNGLEAK
jgi:hypothetical protein